MEWPSKEAQLYNLLWFFYPMFKEYIYFRQIISFVLHWEISFEYILFYIYTCPNMNFRNNHVDWAKYNIYNTHSLLNSIALAWTFGFKQFFAALYNQLKKLHLLRNTYRLDVWIILLTHAQKSYEKPPKQAAKIFCALI